MPLTYQGPMREKPVRSLTSAIDKGLDLLTHVPISSLSTRLCFSDLDALSQSLSQSGLRAQTWMDIAVYPTDSFFAEAIDLTMSAMPFRISTMGRVGSTAVEITLESEQAEIRRFDDRLCYENSDAKSALLRVEFSSTPSDLDKQNKDRWRILHRFHLQIAHVFEGLEYPGEMEQDIEPIADDDRQWLPQSSRKCDDSSTARYLLNRSEKQALGLQIRCPVRELPALSAAWSRLINQLSRLEIAQLRLVNELTFLKKLTTELDLHHDHRWGDGHRFGFTFSNVERIPNVGERLKTLSAEGLLNALSEWDLRWSGYWGAPEADCIAADCAESRYVIRSTKGSTSDLLFIELPFDDPDGTEFRNARQELSAIFHKKLSEKKAWQYEGPQRDSSIGTANEALNQHLHKVVLELERVATDEVPMPPAPPGIISSLSRFFRRKGFEDLTFADLLTNSITDQLSGFRYDEQAHVSDIYFMEFYRKRAGGFELIQVQRLRNPSRFRFVLGISQFKVYLDELQPTTHRVAPGIAVEFHTLLPEDWDGEYVMYGARDQKRVVAIATKHLLHFGEPFFESVRPVMAEHIRQNKKGT